MQLVGHIFCLKEKILLFDKNVLTTVCVGWFQGWALLKTVVMCVSYLDLPLLNHLQCDDCEHPKMRDFSLKDLPGGEFNRGLSL